MNNQVVDYIKQWHDSIYDNISKIIHRPIFYMNTACIYDVSKHCRFIITDWVPLIISECHILINTNINDYMYGIIIYSITYNHSLLSPKYVFIHCNDMKN